jgi:hypothetical protein
MALLHMAVVVVAVLERLHGIFANFKHLQLAKAATLLQQESHLHRNLSMMAWVPMSGWVDDVTFLNNFFGLDHKGHKLFFVFFEVPVRRYIARVFTVWGAA